MPRYLSLINFTDQGIRAVDESINRAEHFKASVAEAGGKVEAIYWAVGNADGGRAVRRAHEDRAAVHDPWARLVEERELPVG